MTLYLYRIGEATPVLEIEDVVSYTADQVVTAEGTVYGPFAGDCELSETPDCTGTLRAGWRWEHPSAETRLEELESLMADMLFGSQSDGGEVE